MPDDFDRAAERELQLREDALRDQAARAQIGDAGQWQRLSAKYCQGDRCGTPIPDARRKALPGVELCVECQQTLERKGRR